MEEYNPGILGGAGLWCVPDLLIRFVRAVYKLNRCDPKDAGVHSPQQIRALLYLIHHDGATIKELAHALDLSEARASRLADELVEDGHIAHRRDTLDRRQVRLYVEPAAAEKAKGIYHERTNALRAALAGVPPHEVRIFTDCLTRVVEEFEALSRHEVAQKG